MLVTAQEMRDAEESAFANGLDQSEVIHHAGTLVARPILALFPDRTGTVLALPEIGASLPLLDLYDRLLKAP